MSADSGAQKEIIRWPTAGRRQPLLVGKDLSGRKIPFGPFTIYQIIGAIIVALVGWNTKQFWGTDYDGLVVIVGIVISSVAAGWLLGMVNFGNRNPIWAAAAFMGALKSTVSRSLEAIRSHDRGRIEGVVYVATNPSGGARDARSVTAGAGENDAPAPEPRPVNSTAPPERPERPQRPPATPVRQSGLESFLSTIQGER